MNVVSKLGVLAPGQKAKILKIGPGAGLNRRVVEMGLTPGAVIEVERVAPLGDPMDIKVKGYHLSLRRRETQHIEVELL
ncbi:ferrous iron transport protein A [Desulfacinum infernum DSM 9756]|jgi:Fe2+ transport system protein FeoA|uniref:Ferrous iron transport protein A n=1 Tax=Desulfacinum infernum DSM 9756 TaxID=1121391 RepID=A0A1M5FVM2_9BACT|nr:ferrous iron transport protein A [Desulfacinum infernum]SHF95600.1 ferrous iron transport protein A [Desulfacinum infernum DSM 9756]